MLRNSSRGGFKSHVDETLQHVQASKRRYAYSHTPSTLSTFKQLLNLGAMQHDKQFDFGTHIQFDSAFHTAASLLNIPMKTLL